MMHPDEHSGRGPLGLGAADLDGHTIEELTDYLEAGRTPVDPSIEQSSGCQLALDALERLHGLGPALLDADAATQPAADAGWVDRILSGIAIDARAGRRIPFVSPDATIDLGITEGAVRGLIRSAENAVPGLLVGRCRIAGDVSVPGEPVSITIDASALYGEPLSTSAERLRDEVRRRLEAHTPLDILAIDVVIGDIQEVTSWTERRS